MDPGIRWGDGVNLTSSSDDLFVGGIALILLPLIRHRFLKALRTGRVPVYRTYLQREESEAKFRVMLGLHALSFLAVAFIAFDLLFDFRSA